MAFLETAAIIGGGLLGGLLGGGGKGGGSERVPPEPPTPEEEFLLELLMNMYANPDADPQEVMTQYLDELGVAKDFYEQFPEYAASQITGQVDAYKQDLRNIASTPGVALSFGGRPVMTTGGTQAQIKPIRSMAMQSDLATKGFDAGYKGVGDILNALQNSVGARVGLAGERMNAVNAPATDLWKSMMTARHSVPVATEEYRPGFIEQFLPQVAQIMASGGGNQNTITLKELLDMNIGIG